MWRYAILVGVCALLLHCEDKKEKEAQKLYDAAIQYSNNQDYDKALELLQRIKVEYLESKTADKAETQIESIENLRHMLMDNQRAKINQRFTRIALALDNYKRRYRAYPITLEDLKKLPEDIVPEFKDDLGNPIFYRGYPSEGISELEPDNYALGCFGSDGLPGGKGKDSDYFYQNGKEVSHLVLPN